MKSFSKFLVILYLLSSEVKGATNRFQLGEKIRAKMGFSCYVWLLLNRINFTYLVQSSHKRKWKCKSLKNHQQNILDFFGLQISDFQVIILLVSPQPFQTQCWLSVWESLEKNDYIFKNQISNCYLPILCHRFLSMTPENGFLESTKRDQ